MLQTGALAAEDMRWLWGPRTVVVSSNSLGTCDYVLSFIKGTGSSTGSRIQTKCDQGANDNHKGPQSHHTSSAADDPPSKVGESKQRNIFILSSCAAPQ